MRGKFYLYNFSEQMNTTKDMVGNFQISHRKIEMKHQPFYTVNFTQQRVRIKIYD
eukprot:UN17103